MKTLVVHTPNPKYYINSDGDRAIKMNWRFDQHYWGDKDNYDRLTIVGVPNEETKELSIGISFCSYPDNFSKPKGTHMATLRASGQAVYADNTYTTIKQYRPYVTIKVNDFTQETCLNFMYELHAGLVKMSIKEVKKLINQQILK